MNSIVEVETAGCTLAAKNAVVLATDTMTYVQKVLVSTSAIVRTPRYIGSSVNTNGPNSLNFEGGLISAA